MEETTIGCQHRKRDIEDTLKNFQELLRVDLRLESRTVKIHCRNVKCFLKKIGKRPSEVSKLDVRSYLHERINQKSRSTVNNDLKSLKRFFRDFLDRPEVVNSFRFPQSPFRSKTILSRNDLKRAYQTIESDLGKALFLFFASSGLRRSEVLGLTFDEVDFKKRMVMPKHEGSTKHSYISFYNGETEKAFKTIDLDGDRLFKISDRQFRKIWKTASKQTGLTISPQKLREWFCCEMGNLGVSDRYIDAFCGRTPKSVLARHYTDYNPERLKRIYDDANLKVLI